MEGSKLPLKFENTLFYGTVFQVVIMPGRWAMEWGQNQGEVIAQAMEAKVGGANLPIDGGGTGSSNRN